MRFPLRALWLLALILACVPMHVAWRAVRAPSPWPRRFLRWSTRAIGLRVTVAGAPAASVVLYAANHQSWIDILLIGGATDTSFVAKESVRKWPGAGWLATMVGTIYVANSDRRAAGAQAGTIRDALARGRSVAFFPEGRLNNGRLMPFRPALFGAVTPPDLPVAVQPVAIDYGGHGEALIWRSGSHMVRHAVRVMNRPGVDRVELHFLEPVHPGDETHRKELARHCEELIAERLGELPAREAA